MKRAALDCAPAIAEGLDGMRGHVYRHDICNGAQEQFFYWFEQKPKFNYDLYFLVFCSSICLVWLLIIVAAYSGIE